MESPMELTYSETMDNAAFYRDSFADRPYIHNMFCPVTKTWRFRLILVWKAFTPGRRPAKFFHAKMFGGKYCLGGHFCLPKLRKGYLWSGPYVLEIIPPEKKKN